MKHRTRKRTNRPNPLRTALNALDDAIADLCAPRTDGNHWAPSRYHELADAIDITASRAGAGDGTSRTPCWIDPLMLKIRIDHRVHHATGVHAPVPVLLRNLPRLKWRPQDVERIGDIAAEIAAWCQAVDDLQSPQPLYLTGYPCPQCGQLHAEKIRDDGQRIRTDALAVAADERGAWCQSCHQRWEPPAGLFVLGRLLEAASA